MKDRVATIAAVALLILLCVWMLGTIAASAPANTFSIISRDVFPPSGQSYYPDAQKTLVAPGPTPAP